MKTQRAKDVVLGAVVAMLLIGTAPINNGFETYYK